MSSEEEIDINEVFSDIMENCSKEEKRSVIKAQAQFDQFEAACEDGDVVSAVSLLSDTLDSLDKAL